MQTPNTDNKLTAISAVMTEDWRYAVRQAAANEDLSMSLFLTTLAKDFIHSKYPHLVPRG